MAMHDAEHDDSHLPRIARTDAEQMLFLVQGAMTANLHMFAREHLRQPTMIEQPTDDDGIVLPYFLMTMASGIVLRIQFSVEDVP